MKPSCREVIHPKCLMISPSMDQWCDIALNPSLVDIARNIKVFTSLLQATRLRHSQALTQINITLESMNPTKVLPLMIPIFLVLTLIIDRHLHTKPKMKRNPIMNRRTGINTACRICLTRCQLLHHHPQSLT